MRLDAGRRLRATTGFLLNLIDPLAECGAKLPATSPVWRSLCEPLTFSPIASSPLKWATRSFRIASLLVLITTFYQRGPRLARAFQSGRSRSEFRPERLLRVKYNLTFALAGVRDSADERRYLFYTCRSCCARLEAILAGKKTGNKTGRTGTQLIESSSVLFSWPCSIFVAY